MVSQTNINAFADVSRFGALRSEAGKDPASAVGKVAREFEALFIEMMLTSARKAAIKGGMFESHALELYKEMFDTQAAQVLSEQGTLGFEQAISRFAGLSEQTEPVQSHGVTHAYSGRPEIDDAVALIDSRASTQGLNTVRPVNRPNLSAPSHPQAALPSSSDVSNPPNAELLVAKSRTSQPPVSAPQHDGVGAAKQYSFSRAIAPYASEAAQKLGTEPAILIAQAALETGWGAHVIPGEAGSSSNNLFGIKASDQWQGGASQVTTLEFLGGRPINTKASFRRYPDIKSAFDDYVHFVKENPRYRNALENAADGEKYIRELARAGYATDPKYAEKIISIKNRIESMQTLANIDPFKDEPSTGMAGDSALDVAK